MRARVLSWSYSSANDDARYLGHMIFMDLFVLCLRLKTF